MGYSIRDLQARLNALGYNAGGVDGQRGPQTNRALKAAKSQRKTIFHKSGLHRVHMHWTAGAYGDIELERKSYHLLVQPDGRVVQGNLAPESNANTSDGQYAPHTRAANSGAIGIALDAMAGARERPFSAGSAPITERQLDAMCEEIADLCLTYDIPVTKWSVLSHSEIQPTLGIRQRNKWDINWIPGMDRPGDPIQVGNEIRKRILQKM